MTFPQPLVTLRHDASPAARSIVHSHQDSFGHTLQVLGPVPGNGAHLRLTCDCGWTGSVPAADVVPDDVDGGLLSA